MLVSTTKKQRKEQDAILCECGTAHLFTVSSPVQMVVIKCDCGKLVGWVCDRRELLPITRELQNVTINS